jgi:hypothetical protein
MKHFVWLVRFTVKLAVATTLVVIFLGQHGATTTIAASASPAPVVVTRHGVLKSTTLRDCRVASSVPCSLFDGIDSGWLDEDYGWHSVWTTGPSGRWHWATKAERVRFGLTLMNQVQRRHGRITWFRGPTGETWCNCPGYDSEHWPEGQAPS